MIGVYKQIFILLIISFFWFDSVSAESRVNVGGYIFPPFVEESDDGLVSGITIDMLEALNLIQDKYKFHFVLTSPRRRYQSFKHNSFDMLFFEDIQWEWEQHSIEATQVFLTGGEVFIALKENVKAKDYFNQLNDKSIAGVLGYHYQFAQFNSDPDYLKSKLNIYLSSDIDRNIQLVLKGRIDVAIVTKSYLNKFLLENSAVRSKLAISKKLDQEYHHTILVRKGTIPGVVEMNALIDKLIETGEFTKILNKYGIEQ